MLSLGIASKENTEDTTVYVFVNLGYGVWVGRFENRKKCELEGDLALARLHPVHDDEHPARPDVQGLHQPRGGAITIRKDSTGCFVYRYFCKVAEHSASF